MKPILLVIMTVKHIKSVCSNLESITDVTYYDDPTLKKNNANNKLRVKS
jgi:hypothetical protein